MKLLKQTGFAAIVFFAASFFGLAQPVAVTNLWKFAFPFREFNREATSTAAIGADDTIYQATFEGWLLAITPQGNLKWRFKAGREVASSPAIADDGTIYFGSRDRKFYAVTPEGKLKWTFATDAWIDSSPAIATDGTIYFGGWDKNFYALNPDGSLKWKFATSNIVDSSPAIATDGTIYFGSHNRNFYALNPNGSLKWKFLSGGEIISSPAIAANGDIYFTALDGNLYALNPDGKKLWQTHTGGATASSPVLDTNGNIYLSVNRCQMSFSSKGEERWEYTVDVPMDVSPAVAGNGEVYFTWPWREMYAFAWDKKILWLTDFELNMSTSPTINSEGIIFASDGKWLYAIKPPENPAPPAKSSWPLFRADARHTGRVQKTN